MTDDDVLVPDELDAAFDDPESSPPDDLPAARRRRRRPTLLIVLAILAVPIAVIVAGLGWLAWQLDPPGGPGAPVAVDVRKGWGVGEIGDALHDKGVIGSSLVFQGYARLQDSGSIQAGHYRLRHDMGARAALDVLERGPSIHYGKLAVVPGLWLSEVGTRVHHDVPRLSTDKFHFHAASGTVRSAFQPAGGSNLEGMLWPDTYRVADSEQEDDVLRTMVRTFDEKARAAGLTAAGANGLSPYEIVTVASLVQQEAKLDSDRPLIASVIYNRLRAGMPLQIDATVLYCNQRRTVSNTATDRARPCPQNTYLNKGLPATPIGSVTSASLDAALHPASSDYLYYVLADASGRHAFAKTYDEHLANVQQARERGLLG